MNLRTAMFRQSVFILVADIKNTVATCARNYTVVSNISTLWTQKVQRRCDLMFVNRMCRLFDGVLGRWVDIVGRCRNYWTLRMVGVDQILTGVWGIYLWLWGKKFRCWLTQSEYVAVGWNPIILTLLSEPVYFSSALDFFLWSASGKIPMGDLSVISKIIFISLIGPHGDFQGRCSRENPPCKYYHPPQHLKDQLLINGRNHLAMKNILVQQMQMQAVNLQPQLQMQPQISLMNPYYNPGAYSAGAPYLSSGPAFMASAPSPGPSGSGMSSHGDATASTSMSPLATANLLHHQMQQSAGNKNRMDRLEVCREFSRGSCRRSELECRYAHPAEHVQVTDNMVVVCMDSLKGKVVAERLVRSRFSSSQQSIWSGGRASKPPFDWR